MGRIIESNSVTVSGIIAGDFVFSHEVQGEKFYSSSIESRRLSGKSDFVPLVVSERLIGSDVSWNGKRVAVTGTFRSYNKHTENGSHLILFVFADEVLFGENVPDGDINYIHMDGVICKPPIYRETPLGREISDILLAVNRPYGKSDYIPCICWGRNAKFAENMQVADRISIDGRIQSREYDKRIGDEEYEKRTAIEVSVNTVRVAEESEVKENV